MSQLPVRPFATNMAFAFVLCLATIAQAQNPSGKSDDQALPLQPRQPGGFLSERLGTYVQIEGVLYDGQGKVESNTLVVDAVDGKRLVKPILIRVKTMTLPAKTRCVFKGYELGEMIGRPPAEYEAAKELGKDREELARRDAIAWQWRPYFVPLVVVEPASLQPSAEAGALHH